MQINDKKTVKDLQDEFSRKFPLLKIEFYKTRHETTEGTTNSQKYKSDKKIGAIRKSGATGTFVLDPNLKVQEFESKFRDYFQLNVQVFRKSGTVWLQTTKTDAWTLFKQNSKGK